MLDFLRVDCPTQGDNSGKRSLAPQIGSRLARDLDAGLVCLVAPWPGRPFRASSTAPGSAGFPPAWPSPDPPPAPPPPFPPPPPPAPAAAPPHPLPPPTHPA